MTSSTDRYIITFDSPGQAVAAGGASRSLKDAQVELADKRRFLPSVTYRLARMIVCDDSGNPIPGLDEPGTGDHPPTGQPEGSNGASGISAATPGEPLRAYRDEYGQIRVGRRIVAYSRETREDLISERTAYQPTDKWWHMLTAAIDFIDREEAERAAAAPEPGVWVTTYDGRVIAAHPSELAALRAVHDAGILNGLRAIHLPYGTTLEEAIK